MQLPRWATEEAFPSFSPPHHHQWTASLRQMVATTIHPLTSLTSEFEALLRENADRCLRDIINANINTRFAGSSPALANFCRAVANKDMQNDATVLNDFRCLVSLTDYESYRPFINKFTDSPCKLSEVENLLAPGLPHFLCPSSSTSGKKSKLFPRILQSVHSTSFRELYEGRKAVIVYGIAYEGFLDVVTDSGEIAHRIALGSLVAARWRASMDWTVETDDARMMSIGTHPIPERTGNDDPFQGLVTFPRGPLASLNIVGPSF